MLKIIKNLLNRKLPVINIEKEFEKRFNIEPDKISEHKNKNQRVYITHEFEAQHIVNIYVLKTQDTTEEFLDEVLSEYTARIALSIGHYVYYQVHIETI